MNEQELLLHRFVDGDLSPEERVVFLEALDTNAALRRLLLDIEKTVAQADRLPRTAPPPEFTAQVLKRLPALSEGWLVRLRARLSAIATRPWSLAKAAAFAGWLFAVGTGLITGWVLHQTTVVQTTMHSDAEHPVYVRLVFLDQQAESVTVAGDFNGWDPRQTPLHRTSGGLWSLMIPLNPGRYHYMYVINGRQWVPDPLAVEWSADGFGSDNAVLDVGDLL